jgi:Na+/melibiose symporter-like transporter
MFWVWVLGTILGICLVTFIIFVSKRKEQDAVGAFILILLFGILFTVVSLETTKEVKETILQKYEIAVTESKLLCLDTDRDRVFTFSDALTYNTYVKNKPNVLVIRTEGINIYGGTVSMGTTYKIEKKGESSPFMMVPIGK